MKSALTVVLFRLFTIGVFVDGNEASNVSVMEGDSVTLKSGFTNVQTDDDIEWRFNGIRIDIFRDSLQLDSQTGDLKISNIRTKDSGLYKVKISSTRGSPIEMEFNVKVVFADEVKSMIVNEGYPVPLHTDPTYIQGSDVIRWRFGQQKSLVAEINRTAGIFNTYDAVLDGRFRDRLKLDHQTGSLNITNTRTTDSGLYEAEISSTRSSYTMHYTQSFSVTVKDSGVQSGSGVQSDSGVQSGSGPQSAVPDAGISSGAVAGIALLAVAVGAAVGAAGFVYYRRKNSEPERQREENGVNLNTKKTDDHATEESKLPTDS